LESQFFPDAGGGTGDKDAFVLEERVQIGYAEYGTAGCGKVVSGEWLKPPLTFNEKLLEIMILI
jgi:hypothetical protein